ncbi:MAG: DUF4340 domain-containing protein [Deltaproteobacteria bacterium]|nr:DUF4340 domain-containing protein [Deltaproteobacteria bacterium]
MSRAVPFTLAILCLLVFAAVAQRKGGEKVGVKVLTLDRPSKDLIDKIEVTLPGEKPAAAGADAGPAHAAGPVREVTLVKEGDSWKVFDPKKSEQRFAVDEAQVKTALGAVAELQPGDLVSNKPDQLASFEIDDAHGHHVRIHSSDGRTLALVFGRSIKSGNVTVRVPGSNDVFIAKGRLGALLMKEVGGWRNKSLFDLKADDIVSVTTTSAAGERWAIAGTPPPEAAPTPESATTPPPKTEWRLVEPATLPAGFRLDKNQLARPAAQLAGLRAQDFADGVSDAQAGLDVAHVVVAIGHKNGTTLVLHVGKEDADKRIYARADGDPQTYLLPSYVAKQLDRKLDDFRDLLLFSATIDEVERATFKGASGTVVLKRGAAGFTVVEPKTPPAEFDVGQAQNQVAAALRLRAARMTDVKAAAAGLDKAGTLIELQLKGGKRQVVRIGAPVPLSAEEQKVAPGGKAPEPREFYASSGVDPLVYAVAAYTKKRYDKPADLFKKPAPPPGGMGGMGGMGGQQGSMHGLEGLPPDVRKKLEESLKKGELPGAP